MRGILYPKNYFSFGPDEAFEAEYELAMQAGVPVAFYGQESLNFDDFVKLYLLDTEVESYVYRGWMLSEEEYIKLERSFEKRNSSLTVPTSEYLKSHSFDKWYPHFKNFTFPSVIIQDPTNEAELDHAANFLGEGGFFVKDFIKSSPNGIASYAKDSSTLHETVQNFVDEKGSALEGNVVVRKFVELDKNVAEMRTWWVNGALAVYASHPNFLDKPLPRYEDVESFLEDIENAVTNYGGFFVTVDIARTVDGSWVIVEVGNGQVSGMPVEVDIDAFKNLFSTLSN